MFRALKLKFIGISALSMLIVLVIVLGLVNLITYRNALDEIFNTLDFISGHSDGYLQEKEIKAFKNKDITVETQYESRYIVLNVSPYGDIISYDNEHIAAITENDIEDFSSVAINTKSKRGLFDYNGFVYAYYRVEQTDGIIKITILDCTRNLSIVHYFVSFSIYVGALSMLLLILLLSVFSRKAVQPYIKNHEAQKMFITNASHELKTPLSVISANTEVIEMMGGKNEWTESTINQVKRMTDLISQLVVLSKLEERQDIVLTDVDMSEEAKSVVSSLKTVAETQGKTLKYKIADNIHVNADENGMHELISILLDNAVKYCDENGMIELNLSQKGKTAVLTITNDYKDGEGEDLSRYFDRFYRADESHNSARSGYGIGLSMAESLVGMFKGKISVSYKKTRIKFTVTI